MKFTASILTSLTIVFTFMAFIPGIANADMIGYWRFEEGTAGNTASGAGSILDSAFANHGTPIGNPVYSSDVPVSSIPQTGQANSLSLDLDGVGDTVLIQTSAALDSAGPTTIEFWMRSTDTRSGQKLLVDKSHGFVDNTGWFFQTGSGNGNVAFGMGNGSFPGIGSANDLFDDEWHHLAGTYDGNAMEFFVDGVSQGSLVIGTYLSNTRDIRIGSASNNGRFFDGFIDELRISDEVLAPSQFLMRSVPEPGSAIVFGLFGIGMFARRKRS